MRAGRLGVLAVLVLLGVLASGCTFPDLATTPAEDAPHAPADEGAAPAQRSCGLLEVNGPDEVVAWRAAPIDAWFTSCEPARNVTLVRHELCTDHGIELALERGASAWRLLSGRPALPLGSSVLAACDDDPRLADVVSPAASVRERVVWDGTAEVDGEPHALPPGAYALVARAAADDGSTWEARAAVAVLPPRLPDYDDADADVRLHANGSARVGGRLTLEVENVGDVARLVDASVGPCRLTYFRADATPIHPPQGARCGQDAASLAPGAGAALLAWDLTRCLAQDADCLRPVALEPGVYHVYGAFPALRADGTWDASDVARPRLTIEVLPAS